jgi:hypothetical protein
MQNAPRTTPSIHSSSKKIIVVTNSNSKFAENNSACCRKVMTMQGNIMNGKRETTKSNSKLHNNYD